MQRRVVLVEDNRLFRETLELLLGLREGSRSSASVGGGAEAVEVCAELAPDVVLIDYRMPGLDGAAGDPRGARASPGDARVCLTASVTGGGARARARGRRRRVRHEGRGARPDRRRDPRGRRRLRPA